MSRKRKQRKSAGQTRETEAPPSGMDIHYTLFHRLYLLATAFLCGAAIMIIELTGNRVLAPWFGNSLYTWTGLIGVILVSLSCGYYVGGYLADKRPGYVMLAHILAISAFLTLLIPIFKDLLDTKLTGMGVATGPVVASLLLFAVPGCMLGAASPYCIKLTSLISRDRQVGLSAGTIAMISTMASVLGTFLAGFVLIPHMDLRHIFLAVGMILGAMAILGYCVFLQKHKTTATVLAGFVLLVTALPSVSTPELPKGVLYEQTSLYQRTRVIEATMGEGQTVRLLNLDSTIEGGQFLESDELPIEYQKYWELGKAFCPGLDRALFLGGGGFGMPEALLDAKPGAKVDVVEIDPAVIQVGREFFKTRDYPGLNCIPMDARKFLLSSSDQYDLIFGDAYHGVQSIPPHLVTAEFFELVATRLSDSGIYMMNIVSAVRGPEAKLFEAISKTLSKSFPHVYVFALDPGNLSASQNVILVGTSSELDIRGMLHAPARAGERVTKLLKTFVEPGEYDFSGGVLLTDNYNPIDLFVAESLKRS